MYSVVPRSSSWSSPSWGMDAAAVASPNAAMRRKIQQLQCEIRVSCDGLATSYLDGLFGIHMLDSAEKACSRATKKSTGADPEEMTLPVDFWSTMPSYLRCRTAWVGLPAPEIKKPPSAFNYLHFSRKLLSSACGRLRGNHSVDVSFEYSLLYLWHGSVVMQVFDRDGIDKNDHPPPTPSFTATLFFLGDNYESQMIWLRPFLHTLLCEELQAGGTDSLRPSVRLSLKINFALCSAPIYPVPGESMALRLQVALREKIAVNWIGMPFISYIHMNNILDQETMVHCLARDQKFFDGCDDDPKEISQRTVVRWLSVAPGMLTVCLLQNQDFSSLEFLVREGIKDDNFSAGLVIGRHGARSDGHSPGLDALLSLKPSYSARRLVATRNIFEVRMDEVIPMFYRETEGISRLDGRSEVHMVHIEPGYQNFTENPLDTFLLKRFRISRGSGTSMSYDGFSRLSHNNLVTHLGGWSTEHELFLIFPAPMLTLKDLLQSRRQSYNTEEGVMSVMGELIGIVNAIGYLSQLQATRTGFHHGIRPENILLFPQVEQKKDFYTWKLGSFGTDSEMFNFVKQTKTNVEGNSSRNYTPPKSLHDPDQPSDQISGKLDVWSFGCVCVEILYWLTAQVDEQVLADHYEMWKPGSPFWEKSPEGEEILHKSVTQLLDMIMASKSLPDSMKLIANLASPCLLVDQEARVTPSLLASACNDLYGTSRSANSRAAEPEHEPDDDLVPYSPSLAPSKVFSLPSLASSATSMELDDTALFLESNPSSLEVQINAIDGWAMAELGLGVEPYIAEEIQQWKNVNATQKIAQRSFAGQEEASTLGAGKLALSKETYVTEGAKSSESEQFRNKASEEAADDVTNPLRINQLNPKDDIVEPPQSNVDSAEPKPFLGTEIIPWNKLSTKEQEACVGFPLRPGLGSLLCFEPKGPLLELWNTRVLPQLLEVSRDPAVLKKIHGTSRGSTPAFSIELFVVRRHSDQQLRPTIFTMSAAMKISQRVAQIMRKHQAWKALKSSFDIIAYTEMQGLRFCGGFTLKLTRE